MLLDLILALALAPVLLSLRDSFPLKCIRSIPFSRCLLPPPLPPPFKILAAQSRSSSVGGDVTVNPAEEAEFMFIGKAMAHKSDRGAELVPIARSLAHLPETVPLEVCFLGAYLAPACPRAAATPAREMGEGGG